MKHINNTIYQEESMHDTAKDAEKIGAKLGEGGSVVSDTVKAKAGRIIDRLMSSDPDFDDCEAAADIVRDLLPENERLKSELEVQAHFIEKLHGYEARLRELANAEPVASISQLNLEMLAEGKAAVVYPKILSCADVILLIPRPEMPNG